MIAHPIGYIVFFCIVFYILGLDSKIRKRIRHNSSKFSTDKRAGLLGTIYAVIGKIGIYNIILCVLTVITLIVCWLSPPETKTVIGRRYGLIMFVILIIKRLIDLIIFQKSRNSR